MKSLIQFTDIGLYCPQANIYIDPWRPVKNALITHAHSDHARSGHQYYLSTKDSIPILKYRLGSFINIQGLAYNEKTQINGVTISFHPAGHIIGSAQIRLEYKGEIWVVSGDYKLENDGISTPFEPVKCHSFITESTFGLPAFKWKEQQVIFDEINQWWRTNQSKGVVCIIAAYSLGKAQRLLQNLDLSIGKVFAHGAIENTHEVLKKQGLSLYETLKVDNKKTNDFFAGSMVIAPPASIGSTWSKKFGSFEEAHVSGWMAVRGMKKRRNLDQGFVLSDHADWDGLNTAIRATGAENIYVTHGYTEIFAKWLSEQGYNAHVVKTEFGDDLADINETP